MLKSAWFVGYLCPPTKSGKFMFHSKIEPGTELHKSGCTLNIAQVKSFKGFVIVFNSRPVTQAQKNAQKRATEAAKLAAAKKEKAVTEYDFLLKGKKASARPLPDRDLPTKFYGKYLDPNARSLAKY